MYLSTTSVASNNKYTKFQPLLIERLLLSRRLRPSGTGWLRWRLALEKSFISFFAFVRFVKEIRKYTSAKLWPDYCFVCFLGVWRVSGLKREDMYHYLKQALFGSSPNCMKNINDNRLKN